MFLNVLKYNCKCWVSSCYFTFVQTNLNYFIEIAATLTRKKERKENIKANNTNLYKHNTRGDVAGTDEP